jgi:hypothetical protein
MAKDSLTSALVQGARKLKRLDDLAYASLPDDFGAVTYKAKVQIIDHDTLVDMLHDAYTAGRYEQRDHYEKAREAIRKARETLGDEL